ncbi:MAG: ATP-binding cassette domain-containing protein, partial [Stellaceae bacterium]
MRASSAHQPIRQYGQAHPGYFGNLTFGVTPLLSGAELAVAAGDRICLVGRNGSGKSALLRIAAGLVQPDAGYRFAQPGATIRYLSQEPDLCGF